MVDLFLLLVLRALRGMLIEDSASTQRTKAMKIFLAERRIHQIRILSGVTAYHQIIKYLLTEINDCIENRLPRIQRRSFVRSNLQEVIICLNKV